MEHKTQAYLRGPNTDGTTSGFGPERYRQYVEHLDISEASKAEMLAAVWSIMRSFVDRAFGDDPSQLARNAGDRSYAVRADRPVDAVAFDHITDMDNDSQLTRIFREHADSE